MKTIYFQILFQKLPHKPKTLCAGRPIAVNTNFMYLGQWIDGNLKFDIHLSLLSVMPAQLWVYSIN